MFSSEDRIPCWAPFLWNWSSVLPMWKQSQFETLPLQKPLLAWEWGLYPCIAKTWVVWFKYIWNKRHLICEVVVAHHTYWHSLAFGKGASEPLLPVPGREGVPLYWAWAAQMLASWLSQCLVGNLFSGNQTWLEILYVHPFFHSENHPEMVDLCQVRQSEGSHQTFPIRQLLRLWRSIGICLWPDSAAWPAGPSWWYLAEYLTNSQHFYIIECGFLLNHLSYPSGFSLEVWDLLHENLENYETHLQFHEPFHGEFEECTTIMMTIPAMRLLAFNHLDDTGPRNGMTRKGFQEFNMFFWW